MSRLYDSWMKGWNIGSSMAEKRANRWAEKQQRVAFAQQNAAINQANDCGRGVTEYLSVDMEALVNDTTSSVPTAIAGGTDSIRADMITVLIWEARSHGLPVVVLHNNDSALNTSLANYFPDACMVDRSYPVYDPFYGMSNDQIVDAIMYSAPKNSLKDDTIFLLSGISAYIRCRGAVPNTALLAATPVVDLYDRVNGTVNKGALAPQYAQPILDWIIRGQSQSAALASYFNRLRMHGQGVLRLSKNGPAANICNTTQIKGLLSLDMAAVPSPLVQDLILYELYQAVNYGNPLLLVIDSVNVAANEKMKQLVMAPPAGIIPVLSGTDIYSMLGSTEDAFNSVIGGMSRYFLLKQPNAVTATKWADMLGQYERQTMDQSFNDSMSGFGRNYSVNRNQEYRVSPREMMAMSGSTAYCYDAASPEIIYTQCFVPLQTS